MLDQKNAILAMHIRGDVHRTALPRSLLDITVGADNAAARQQTPRAELGLETQTIVVGSFCAVAASQLGQIFCGPRRHQADDAADSARSIEVAGAAAHHFDAIDR